MKSTLFQVTGINKPCVCFSVAIVCTIFFQFLNHSSQAQNSLRFGLKASPSVSWITPDYKDWKSDGVRIGFGYGLITEFRITDNYSFATGLEFSGRGGRLEQRDTNYIYETGYKLQYIDIPLTLKMKTNEIGYFSYFGQFGVIPSVNIRARGDVGGVNQGLIIPPAKNINITNQIIPIGLSLLIGLGSEYSISDKTSVLFGVSFQKGLTDILKNDDIAGVKYRYKAFGNAVVLNAGILF